MNFRNLDPQRGRWRTPPSRGSLVARSAAFLFANLTTGLSARFFLADSLGGSGVLARLPLPWLTGAILIVVVVGSILVGWGVGEVIEHPRLQRPVPRAIAALCYGWISLAAIALAQMAWPEGHWALKVDLLIVLAGVAAISVGFVARAAVQWTARVLYWSRRTALLGVVLLGGIAGAPIAPASFHGTLLGSVALSGCGVLVVFLSRRARPLEGRI
jgi:hypothetical protein